MRRRLTIPKIPVHAYISQDLYAEVCLLLPHNEFLGKVQHGAVSELIEQLLREWVKKKPEACKEGT